MGKSRIGAGILGVVIAGGVIGTALCVEKIPTGYVGVQYSINGGIQDELLTEGWKIVAPNKKVTLYSVASESLFMSADKKEGSKEDESLNIQCKDGTLNADFEMSYSFDSEKVVAVVEKYRGQSGEAIIDSRIRSKVRTLVSEVTSQYSVLEVHQEKKGEINKAITTHLKETLSDYGIIVESASLPRTEPSAEVKLAIEKRTVMEQEKEAEKQKQEKAVLEAETKMIQAQAEADAKIIKAEADAKANELLQESLTPELVQKQAIDKWDGKLPTVSGANSVITGGIN